jgi:hypothetical protein
MPYLRSFGSLMIAVALSFLIVYPTMLSIMYLMGDVLVERESGYSPPGMPISDYDEEVFSHMESAEIATTFAGSEAGRIFKCVYFKRTGDILDLISSCVTSEDQEKNQPGRAIAFAAYAFIAAVFMPTAALLAAIASVSYIARLYGEEIDLSRITQLV